VFVFFNRRRDRVKLLVWDGNGFWLFYKRLEAGTFRALPNSTTKQVEMRRAELSMLLEGIDLDKGRMRKHFVDGVRLISRDDGSGGSSQSARSTA
jgi:transposase